MSAQTLNQALSSSLTGANIENMLKDPNSLLAKDYASARQEKALINQIELEAFIRELIKSMQENQRELAELNRQAALHQQKELARRKDVYQSDMQLIQQNIKRLTEKNQKDEHLLNTLNQLAQLAQQLSSLNLQLQMAQANPQPAAAQQWQAARGVAIANLAQQLQNGMQVSVDGLNIAIQLQADDPNLLLALNQLTNRELPYQLMERHDLHHVRETFKNEKNHQLVLIQQEKRLRGESDEITVDDEIEAAKRARHAMNLVPKTKVLDQVSVTGLLRNNPEIKKQIAEKFPAKRFHRVIGFVADELLKTLDQQTDVTELDDQVLQERIQSRHMLHAIAGDLAKTNAEINEKLALLSDLAVQHAGVREFVNKILDQIQLTQVAQDQPYAPRAFRK